MPDGPARWDEMGRRPPNGRKVGEHSKAQEEAWKEVRTRTLECGRCGGLTDWRAAKKAARQTKRGRQYGQMRTHDGCRRCSKAKSNAESRQTEARRAGEDGKRDAKREAEAGGMARVARGYDGVGATERDESKADQTDADDGREAETDILIPKGE